jgi:hypothetical protein
MDTIPPCDDHMTWPEAFAVVGVVFGIALIAIFVI